MKQFNLANNELALVHDAVFSIAPSNTKINRGKFNLLKLIKKKLDELNTDRADILKKYSNKDEDGEPIIIDNRYDLVEETEKEAYKELDELGKEKVTIVYGEYANRIKDYMDFLDSYEGNLEGNVGQGIFVLQEAYETSLEGEE